MIFKVSPMQINQMHNTSTLLFHCIYLVDINQKFWKFHGCIFFLNFMLQSLKGSLKLSLMFLYTYNNDSRSLLFSYGHPLLI